MNNMLNMCFNFIIVKVNLDYLFYSSFFESRPPNMYYIYILKIEMKWRDQKATE